MELGRIEFVPQPSATQSILERLAALERAVGNPRVGWGNYTITSGSLALQPGTDQHDSAK